MKIDFNEFRFIPGLPKYWVSKDGVVLSTHYRKVRELSQWVNSNGYLACKVDNKQMPVHRAVALVWVPNPDKLSDVNHRDGNKFNNHYSNLEWCSRTDNLYHALRNGLHDERETPVIATHIDTGKQLRFHSQAEAGKHGFSQPNINKCLKGVRPHHKRYVWRYDENSVT